MKVGFLTADWGISQDKVTKQRTLIPGGSGWYRIHLPANELKNNGIEVVISEQVSIDDNGLVLCDWQDGTDHDDCDIIVMQRVMNDFGIDLVNHAHANGQKIINDVDDWYWGLHPDNNAYRATDSRFNPDSNKDHYKKTLIASDLVITSTPFLSEQIQRWGVNTQVIRNCIEYEKFEVSEQNNKPVIGWVGATTHRSGDLETLRGIIGPFIDRNDLKFHHGGYADGSITAAELLDIEISRSTQTPLCQIELYPQHFNFFDVSIVPLNKIPFNEAKSFIKGIESAAAGKPFISQDTGEYKYLSEEYGLGRVAKRPKDWIRHFNQLLDYDLRVEESKINREIAKKFDIKSNWTNWLDAITSVL
jgi:hypothetical protein